MTGASKILTVSYGTFSCTLEGFDDPFGTMKAIAEYFRDLAAEDRYFGAEPPTPDAAMLHKIAEREIQRRVEAKVQENGVVLRASDGTAPAVTAEPAPKAEPAPVAPRLMDATPQATETVAEKLSRLRAEVAGQAVEPTVSALSLAVPAATAYAVPDFIAPDFGEDEDYDLPATVAAPVAMPEEGRDAALVDADHGIGADHVIADEIFADTLPETEPDPAADLPEELVAEADDALPDFDVQDMAVPVADTSQDVDPSLPVAEAVQSAEPVAEHEAAADAAFEEDTPDDSIVADAADDRVQDAPSTEDRTDALLSSLMADLSAPAAADAAQSDAVAPAVAARDFDDDLQETLNAIAAESIDLPADEAEPDAPAEPLTHTDEDAAGYGADAHDAFMPDEMPDTDAIAVSDPAGETEPDSIFASDTPAAETVEEVAAEPEDFSLFSAEDADDGATEPAATAPDVPHDDPDMAAEPVAEAPVAADLRPDASEKLMRARARVVRIRRSEAAETPATAEPAPVAERPAPAATLSPEAEADLAAELAALSAATIGAPDDSSASRDPGPEPDAARDTATDGPALSGIPAEAPRRPFDQAGADDTISRLMAQADEHLEGPESKRRISAIAHLKAAVAATVAERRPTGDKPKDAEPSQLSRYRDDLAKVVRNKLGGGAGPTERLAPLVLVSEQRIDRPRPVAVPDAPPAAMAPPAPQAVAQGGGTVMPRRIAGATGLAFAQDEEEMEDFAEAVADSRDFAEFAERLGAKSLGELIEASAAYLAWVEGREHFTRPQLMGLVQAAMPDGDIPREDGLRSFGTLLRTGRIEKVRRGQFALSDQSAYLAEGRRIAG